MRKSRFIELYECDLLLKGKKTEKMKFLITIILLLSNIANTYSQPLPEQSNGLISGSVVDFVTKQPLIGANILIPGTTIGAATDLNGNFRIDNVNPGTYQLRASVIGYESQTKTDVVVSPGRMTQVTFQLIAQVIEFDGVVVTSDFFRTNPFEEIGRAHV